MKKLGLQFFDIEKLLNLEWKPKYPTSRAAVQKAIDSIGKELLQV